MWCPSVSLSVWANAWLAGRAAPDDVLDALSLWAPVHSVAAYDAVTAGSTGLPWPQAPGAASLLPILRAAGGSTTPTGRPGSVHPVLPIPGDVRGLPAGTRFAAEALAVGEAVIVTGPGGSGAVGLVPEWDDAGSENAGEDPEHAEPGALHWTVYTLSDVAAVEQHSLGEAEHALRSAVRSAAEALGVLGLGESGAGPDDPRALVQQVLESSLHHRIPGHAPVRAVRVLETAAHVDAIITVSGELTATPAVQSASAAQRAADAVRPLDAVVRSARVAAVAEILHSAWRV